jgi:hypothetical protein
MIVVTSLEQHKEFYSRHELMDSTKKPVEIMGKM